MQKLKGLQFQRARVPHNAVDTNVHLACCVDAADSLKVVGIWARFKVKSGGFSSQLVIGRSLLSKGGTIPKEELEAATIGSNLLWIVRKALEGVVIDYSVFSDSAIAICWITSENKKLSLYHRNRVVQFRFHTDLSKISVEPLILVSYSTLRRSTTVLISEPGPRKSKRRMSDLIVSGKMVING